MGFKLAKFLISKNLSPLKLFIESKLIDKKGKLIKFAFIFLKFIVLYYKGLEKLCYQLRTYI